MKAKQKKDKVNMTSPAIMNNDNGSILVKKDPRMLYEEEVLHMQKSDDDDDQIKEQPVLSDLSRHSYVYANEDQDNDQYFQTGIYKK